MMWSMASAEAKTVVTQLQISLSLPSSVVFLSRLVLLWAVAALQGVDFSGPLNDVCAMIYPLNQ